MTDRLTEALAHMKRSIETEDDLYVVFQAARRWDALDSDENVEVAAEAIEAEVKKWPTPPPSGVVEPGWWGATMTELARAALRAVKAGED